MSLEKALDEYDRKRGTTPDELAAREARAAAIGAGFFALCDEGDAS